MDKWSRKYVSRIISNSDDSNKAEIAGKLNVLRRALLQDCNKCFSSKEKVENDSNILGNLRAVFDTNLQDLNFAEGGCTFRSTLSENKNESSVESSLVDLILQFVKNCEDIKENKPN